MSKLTVLILLSALLVNTHSSPISEPPEAEDSPLPEADLENVETEKQVQESEVLIPEKNATSDELDSSYCSQFDNSCVKCVKAKNCSMAITTKIIQEVDSNVQRKEYELTCIDINVSIKELQETFGKDKYSIVQRKDECDLKNFDLSNKAGMKLKSDNVPGVMDIITSPQPLPIKTSAADNTNATTNATTKTTPTTSTTTTLTSTNATTITTTTSTTPNTSIATSTTTSNPTSATNSTQIPTTSKDTPTPASSGGWSFWSFFGGILLTLGLPAIGFVGFKYYKARSGQAGGGGLNYNRF
jgi:hypothetical protein